MQSSRFETVSVIGLGYIGLPTAAMFASRRTKVIGVDVNPHAVETINRGRIHIVEPGLEALVREAVEGGFLEATMTPKPADAFLIAVPTPFKGKHEPDTSYVEAAARAIAPVLKKGDLLILESTSPVGTTEAMVGWLSAERPDLSFPGVGDAAHPDVNVAYCPERVLPGQVVRELVQNDRIIGGLTPTCSARATALYRIFVEGALHSTTARTAEMCKLTENSFRDVNIAFANELSIICAKLGIDVRELIELANHHPRVNILQPGAGVGGHCIAVDPWFIVDSAPEEARLIRTAREVNDSKPGWVVERIRQAIADVLATRAGSTESDLAIAVLGLAFKPDIDDLRESPAVQIAKRLRSELSGQVLIVEPHVDRLPDSLSRAQLVSLDDALARADLVAVLVNHTAFQGLKARLRAGVPLVDVVGATRR